MAFDDGSGSLRVNADPTDQLIAATIRAQRSERVDRRVSETNTAADQHQHPADSHKQGHAQPRSKALRLQKQDFGQRHEYRNRRHHHRCDP